VANGTARSAARGVACNENVMDANDVVKQRIWQV